MTPISIQLIIVIIFSSYLLFEHILVRLGKQQISYMTLDNLYIQGADFQSN